MINIFSYHSFLSMPQIMTVFRSGIINSRVVHNNRLKTITRVDIYNFTNYFTNNSEPITIHLAIIKEGII